MKKIVIVGGMAAGCKAAARLKRVLPDSRVTIVEKRNFLSYGSCGMPLYASGEVQSFDELATTPYGMLRNADFFWNVKGVEALTNASVVKIDVDAKIVLCRNGSEEFELEYDELIITTGAKASPTPFPCPESDNISHFHNPMDAKKFREKAQRGEIGSAAIVGGGYIGCELAEALVNLWGIETTIIERESHLLPKSFDGEISGILKKVLENEDICCKTGISVLKAEESGEGISLSLDNGEELNVDYLFICSGTKPETALTNSIGLHTGDYGGILVDERMQTNVPNIWAAGDCVEVKSLVDDKYSWFPLGSLANRQGRVIADNIAGIKSKFHGAAGAISMQVFGFIMAACGFNENEANSRGIEYESVIAGFQDRPDYHPDVRNLYTKMLFSKNEGRLLGLQIAGKGEVTRYIDSFSCLIAGKGTIHDLCDFEHAYNPPHSGPVNPLNFLGYIALSHIDGVKNQPVSVMDDFNGSIIDVRQDFEIDATHKIQNSINIPLHEFRKRAEELNKDENIFIICQKGTRSYEAARHLKNLGYNKVFYMGGGMSMKTMDIELGDEG